MAWTGHLMLREPLRERPAVAPAAVYRAADLPGEEGPGPGGIEYKWVAAAVVTIGALMAILDQTVVNVALPTLEKDFNVALTEVQWIVTAYSLALAAVIPLTGWLCDRYGTKGVFVTSQVLFTAGSVLCGLSWSNSALIGFRVLQGLGGGLIMPVGMTVVMRTTRPEERGRLMAAMGFPMLVGPVLGPTLGGWLVQSVSWRLIFFINLPIGIVGAIAALLLLRSGRSPRAQQERLDVLGLLLVTPGVLGVVYGLSQPSTYGWDSVQTLLPMLAGLALLFAFLLWELRQPAPLIDIRVFRDRAFSASMGVNFLIGVALFGAIFLLPLFLQQIQGYGALDAGVILSAQGLAAGLAMPVAGILTDRVGAHRVVPIGLVALTAGTIWMTSLTPDTPAWTIALMLALRGLGMGFCMMPTISAAFVTMPASMIARATSVSNVVQRVAAGLGVAVLATILANRINANLPPLPVGASAASGGGLADAPVPAALRAYLLSQAAKGFDDTFWASVGLALLCFPMALLLRRALRPSEVRDYAMRQLVEGVVLGAAARRLRDAELNGLTARIDRQSAFTLLSGEARGRLSRATTILRAGTNAAGLVPQAGLSPARRAAFVIFMLVALAGTGFAMTRAFQDPQVSARPHVSAPASQP